MILTCNEHVAIRPLSPTRIVVPLYAQAGDRWHSDIKLPDVVLTSRSDQPVSWIAARLDALVDGDVVSSLFTGAAELGQVLIAGNALLNKLGSRRDGQWRTYNLQILFAAEPERGTSFAESNTLQPSESSCLRLDDLFDCHIAHSSKIDEVRCQLTYQMGSECNSVEFRIPLKPYECKGDYMFPVQGSVTIESTPWDRQLGHRMATSQEFAFDIVDCRRIQDGSLALSSPLHSEHAGDYFIFDREVLAVGKGIVAASGNAWPDAFADNPREYSVERVTAKTEELLSAGMEFAHAILGNYVVIDHQNGEFSLYAHMREGSVHVQPGDSVSQGQAIGRVGNTSNSETPHLHFHLMDSSNYMLANGLPIRFRNLPRTMASIDEYLEPNPLLYSSYIFSHTLPESLP